MAMQPEDVMVQYQTRINRHRFDDLVPLIAENAVFWFSEGSYAGLEAARAAFEAAWRTVQDEVYRLDDIVWIARSEDSASCIYRFHWQGLCAGRPADGCGRGTTVLRRDDGGWRIVHEHLSPLPG